MASILAIENDSKQAALLKCIVRNRVGARLVVVRSKDEAIAAIHRSSPDLILLSARLSARDEADMLGHMCILNGADHLRTLTIPQFTSDGENEAPRGLLGAFRRRPAAQRQRAGDPKQFAEQIAGCLRRAEQIKAKRAAPGEAAPILTATERASAAALAAGRMETKVETIRPKIRPGPVATTPEPPAAASGLPLAEAEVAEAAAADEQPEAADDRVSHISVAEELSDKHPGEESQALLRSLRVPLSIADLARVHGCRIRRVVVSRRSARSRTIAFAAA